MYYLLALPLFMYYLLALPLFMCYLLTLPLFMCYLLALPLFMCYLLTLPLFMCYLLALPLFMCYLLALPLFMYYLLTLPLFMYYLLALPLFMYYRLTLPLFMYYHLIPRLLTGRLAWSMADSTQPTVPSPPHTKIRQVWATRRRQISKPHSGDRSERSITWMGLSNLRKEQRILWPSLPPLEGFAMTIRGHHESQA